jgi:hypothetical protein
MDYYAKLIRPFKKIALSLSILFLGTLSANANNIGVSLKAGTLGLGLEADYKINKNFNVRLQANSYSYSDEFEEDGIDYDGEIDLSTAGLIIDWRPFKSTFRVSAGLYNNGNKLFGRGIDDGNQSYDIGNAEYRSVASDPLIIEANVDLGKNMAGYLGLGWGNAAPSGWMYSFEVGVIFAGKPDVSMGASGSAIVSVSGIDQQFSLSDSSNPLVQELNENIRAEEKALESDISDFEMYPVISLGIGYRF